jgi:glycosyltransferase involved in cell wall biosynthesis
MKRKKAALYDPYLNTLGGGEKHILSLLKVLEDNGIETNIFWDDNLCSEIKNYLGMKFDKINFLPNIFKKKGLFKKIGVLKNFDYFFYVPDGSYFFSSAKKNFIFAMVPKKNLYPIGPLSRLKAFNYKIISNSSFTQKKLSDWDIDSELIYPFIDQRLIDLKLSCLKKENIILSVGRFFSHLHSKRQDLMIKTFQRLKTKDRRLADFRLILAGGLKKEDEDYFNNLKKVIGDDRQIVLKPNIDLDNLYDLYARSRFYWHFAGYGIDDRKNPELVEHLGISPIEAMASGNVVFCYKAGGPKEIVVDQKNGFLFENEEQLLNAMALCLTDDNAVSKITNQAKRLACADFSYNNFKKKVEEVVL